MSIKSKGLAKIAKHRSGLLIALRTYNVHSGHAMKKRLIRYLLDIFITEIYSS
jgi:hypothetical protein